MAYKVIKFFTDLQDNDYAYNVGDTFPREGKSVKQARLNELAGSKNKQGVPLIEEVPEEPTEDFMNPPVDVEDVKEPEETAQPKQTKRRTKKEG